jgi:hypothetical protein
MIAYKYRENSERSLNIIRSRKLYFPHAKQLNDPLDSQINIDQEYNKVVERYPPDHSEEYLRKAFCIYMLNQHKFLDKKGRNIGLNGALQWYISQLGIFSLSATSTDALLWSHYGGAHRGFCLEFDTDLIPAKEIFMRSPVTYAKTPPYQALFEKLAQEFSEFAKPWEPDNKYPDEIGDNFYTRQLSELMEANLFVKSEKWKYEEEYRLIANRSGEISFPAEALRSVTFGINADFKLMQSVETLLQHADYEHVTRKYVRHTAGSFEFEASNFCSSLMTLDHIT